ncbi:hypothetical protein BDZ85DRAFT_264477 [Elsinoe ampelina]|uniref:Uncharacterized protein n=1 Tax=Elsinoe ampelina TaxID=302913 RepID=A0A6A6G902_9PEZI|nr:hypothetical protein BDZ85DRAFT_264477 [Elsinoe ampelina]
MDFFPETTVPSFYIYRETGSDEPFDPTTPLQFFPPKDSDELFFALRNAYPNVATHSDRMRNAVIEFLLTEGQAQQQVSSSQTSPNMTMDNSMIYDSASTSSYSPYISMASSSSASPDIPALNLAASQPVQRTNSQASVAPSQSSAPLDQMTSVFSLTSHSQPKLRVRRKMTEAEKVEYRKRRSAGACQSCSSRKRKCKHNKEAASSITTTATATSHQRVVKALTKKQGKQSAPAAGPQISTMPPLSSKPLISFDNAIPGDLMSFDDAELFPMQADADWTLLDFDAPILPDFSLNHQSSSRVHNDRTSPDGQRQEMFYGRNALGYTNDHLLDVEGPYDPVMSSQQPTHTFHTHDTLSPRKQSDGSTTHPTGVFIHGFDQDEPLRHKTVGMSDTGRGVADGGHGYAPTMAAPSRILANGIASGLSVDDPIAAASVKDRQSLTLRDSGQAPLVKGGVPQGPLKLKGPSPGFSVVSPGSALVAASESAPLTVITSERAVRSRSALVVNSPQDASTMANGLSRPASTSTSSAETVLASTVSSGTSAISNSHQTVVTASHQERGDNASTCPRSAPRSPSILGVSTRPSPDSFTDDFHDVRPTLETYLKTIGEIQLCILCTMLSSLPVARMANEITTLSSSNASAIDDLTSMCSRMQIAAA